MDCVHESLDKGDCMAKIFISCMRLPPTRYHDRKTSTNGFSRHILELDKELFIITLHMWILTVILQVTKSLYGCPTGFCVGTVFTLHQRFIMNNASLSIRAGNCHELDVVCTKLFERFTEWWKTNSFFVNFNKTQIIRFQIHISDLDPLFVIKTRLYFGRLECLKFLCLHVNRNLRGHTQVVKN